MSQVQVGEGEREVGGGQGWGSAGLESRHSIQCSEISSPVDSSPEDWRVQSIEDQMDII